MNSLNPLRRSSAETMNKSAIGSYCSAAGGTTNHNLSLIVKRRLENKTPTGRFNFYFQTHVSISDFYLFHASKCGMI